MSCCYSSLVVFMGDAAAEPTVTLSGGSPGCCSLAGMFSPSLQREALPIPPPPPFSIARCVNLIISRVWFLHPHPDRGGNQGLPGLPAHRVRGLRIHVQTQPLHPAREVPGGPVRLGASREGDHQAHFFSPKAMMLSRWRLCRHDTGRKGKFEGAGWA